MAWKYNDVRIFVTDEGEARKQVIARLQPLAGGTKLQTFGYESDILKLSAYVVSSGDIGLLKYTTTTGDDYALETPWGIVGSYYASAVNSKLVYSISQTLRVDLSCDEPVYIVELELFTE